MNVTHFFVPFAQAHISPPAPGGMFNFQSALPLVFIIAMLYFFVIRPQVKRQKEQKNMLSQLKSGDEVITSSGIVGFVVEIGDHFITIEVSENTQLRIQKSAISQLLPAGTLKSAK